MKTGTVKNFIYMPGLGIIEAGENIDDAVERINRAEVEKEIADKKMIRRLKRMHPNCDLMQIGDYWIVAPH